ncbi:MAG TPA: DNA double-strand break repair nuclease NurA [Anaerolineae bacterium]|nr:DNA double-strand break repair nuclease NurA [Anaerolineae bacterium]
MTLELSKVAHQIDEMGRALAERAQRQRRTLPAARELLRLFANDQERLREVAASEAGQRLRCASPDDEPLNMAGAPHPLPPKTTVVAADGSQIFPDPHAMAFYYAINIGTIIFRAGSGQAPTVSTVPRLYYQDPEIYPHGQPVTGSLVGAQRNVEEVRTLADLALEEAACEPRCAALRDGPLLMWFDRAALPQGRAERLLDDYLSILDRLRTGGVPVAGFVSRPHGSEVVALLYLAHLEPEERSAVDSLSTTDYRGLTDRALFGFLREGERSATFVRGAGFIQDFRARGHDIHFFYLNTGAEIARVEVPEWIARQAQKLDLLHAVLYEQCRHNKGYPYVLTRADELAVILGPERQVLDEMIVQSLLRHGLHVPEMSAKAQLKKVAR